MSKKTLFYTVNGSLRCLQGDNSRPHIHNHYFDDRWTNLMTARCTGQYLMYRPRKVRKRYSNTFVGNH